MNDIKLKFNNLLVHDLLRIITKIIFQTFIYPSSSFAPPIFLVLPPHYLSPYIPPTITLILNPLYLSLLYILYVINHLLTVYPSFILAFSTLLNPLNPSLLNSHSHLSQCLILILILSTPFSSICLRYSQPRTLNLPIILVFSASFLSPTSPSCPSYASPFIPSLPIPLSHPLRIISVHPT